MLSSAAYFCKAYTSYRYAIKQCLKAAPKTLAYNHQFRFFIYEVINPQNEIKPMHLNGYYTSGNNHQIMFGDYSQRLRRRR